MTEILLLLLTAYLLWILWQRRRASRILRREHFIRTYTLPAHLFEMLIRRHGHLQSRTANWWPKACASSSWRT